MIARNAGESLIGRVVVFCIEKSCRPTFACTRNRCAIPSEIDRERQRSNVGLEVGVLVRIRVPKPHNRGIYARLRENPLREPRRKRRVASDGNVKYFKLGSGADTLRMSSTAERPVLLGGGIRLHQETSLDDLLDVRLFSREIPLSVAGSHSEPSGQKQHVSPLNPIWR